MWEMALYYETVLSVKTRDIYRLTVQLLWDQRRLSLLTPLKLAPDCSVCQ